MTVNFLRLMGRWVLGFPGEEAVNCDARIGMQDVNFPTGKKRLDVFAPGTNRRVAKLFN